METDKGFEIKCLNCGSTKCEMEEEGEYDYEEEWHSWGSKIVCNNCGQCN